MNSGTSSQAGAPGYYTGNDSSSFRALHGEGSGRPRDLLEEKYLTVHELARTLRLSVMTVYRAIEEGELEAVRISSHSIRLPKSSAERYLQLKRLPLRYPTARHKGFLDEEYLTVQEFAGILRVSVMTVYRILEMGDLEAIRVSDHLIRIVKRAAEEYIRSSSVNLPGRSPGTMRATPRGIPASPPRRRDPET